ncbi:hypothetical protein [Streptosporangium sp. NPDC002721]|uniref:hypothetical protein n=1 Tax=Streptosporangium sp. NPDC002721 TaxID=3366188 RepID=UPI0036AB65C3
MPVPVNGWDTTAHPRLHDRLAVRLPLDYPALTAPRFGTGAARVLLDPTPPGSSASLSSPSAGTSNRPGIVTSTRKIVTSK